MHLHQRFGIDIHQAADAARLRARKILAHHAAGGQVHRKVVVHGVAALAPLGQLEAALAVGIERDAAFHQVGRPRMIQRGAWPEDAHLTVDFLVGDAIVVRVPPARGFAQFVEDLARLAKREILLFAQSARQVADDIGVAAGVGGRINGFPNVEHASLRVAGDAFFLLLKTARQHHVGVARRLGKKEIGDAEELKLFESLAREVRIGQRHQRVEAN